MLTELFKYGHKIEEEVKAMQSEIKENVQGANSDAKETGTQINSMDQKEERNIQPEKDEETRIQKNEERLRNLWDNFKHYNIWIIGVPGGEECQEIENLYENIRKENFPNLAKEIDFQEVQEAQRVPKKEHTKAHHNYITQDYTEGDNLRSSKRKGHSSLHMCSHKTISWFLKRVLAGKKGLERSIPIHERQGPTSMITLSSKTLI